MSARWSRQILFGDIDAMFASAAVLADPSLAGRPVAVGGPPPRGIIAAASYEVRRFGVRSAMPTIQALRLCPDLILVPPDRELYSRLHRQLQAVTDRFFPETEWTSIDEFYADVTRLQTRHPDPNELGQSLKDDIHRSTGLIWIRRRECDGVPELEITLIVRAQETDVATDATGQHRYARAHGLDHNLRAARPIRSRACTPRNRRPRLHWS